MRDFKVIGLMSGSSLDGVDIAYVNFSHDNKRWFFQIVEAGNVPYTSYWKEQLAEREHTEQHSRCKSRIFAWIVTIFKAEKS